MANLVRFKIKNGLDNNNLTIVNVADPVNNQDAATKKSVIDYVAATAQPLDADLTAIAGISATSGLLKKTAADTWSLDTSVYLTEHPTIAGAANTTNSGLTYVQGLTFDSNGHVTGTASAEIRSATTAQSGVVTLSDAIDSTSTAAAATPSAVKTAYDLAAAAIPASQRGVANGVATLDVNGVVPSSQLPSYVDDVVEYDNSSAFPVTGEQSKIYVAVDTTKVYRWSGTLYVEIASNVGSADQALKLTSARSISATGDADWSVTFDGSANASGTLTLSASGVTTGTYNSVTVDSKGRVTAGTNPTTLAGYGITDAAPIAHVSDATVHVTSAQSTWLGAVTASSTEVNYLAGVTSGIQSQLDGKQAADADLTAIAAITDTAGILKKTAANTWSLDTNTYLTDNQSITISGDATGSGATSIALTLQNVVTAGTYNSVTVDSKGRVTAGTVNTTTQSVNLDSGSVTSSTLTTSTTTANQVVSELDSAAFRSAEYLVQISSGASYELTKLLVIHNGTTAYIMEYGYVSTNGAALAAFDVDLVGGKVRLLVTPENAVTTVKTIVNAVAI